MQTSEGRAVTSFSLKHLNHRADLFPKARKSLNDLATGKGLHLYQDRIDEARETRAFADTVYEVGKKRRNAITAITDKTIPALEKLSQNLGLEINNHPANNKLRELKGLATEGYIARDDFDLAKAQLLDFVPGEPETEPLPQPAERVSGVSPATVLIEDTESMIVPPQDQDFEDVERERRINELRKEIERRIANLKFSPTPKRIVDILLEHLDPDSAISKEDLAAQAFPNRSLGQALNNLSYQLFQAEKSLKEGDVVVGRIKSQKGKTRKVEYFLQLKQEADSEES